ncbi:PdxA family dehydrogenase [Falsiroseomonas oryzae]|uniref:PdxA family dehydrogenase n=1 Tax=Falsiroseomonas oryzae TaxID=2766473 RepID=UPI0022EA919C|nr:4-hydroxythreonine-4-phosphate dehydrogenase PdxA [Roseomonas sp. MO-31]
MTGLPALAIALGDPAGIGPEIALKTALSEEVRRFCRPVLVGDRQAVALAAGSFAPDVALRPVMSPRDAAPVPGCVDLLEVPAFAPGELVPGSVTPGNGRAALAACAAAIRAAQAGEAHAVLAAPMNQTAIAAAGIAFDGYPGFVAQQTGLPPEDVFLMLCFDRTRIVHVTLHVSVAQALRLLTRQRIARAITSTDVALRRLGIAHPRIAVGGLNPHAGEGGLFGEEDLTVTTPAIDDARAAGVQVDGPFGADTMFHKAGYDAFVVMLHDQGHIAAKMVAAHRTAGLSIGSPILFSSVAHGSGHDIVGQGKADPTAMIEAARRLCGAETGLLR